MRIETGSKIVAFGPEDSVDRYFKWKKAVVLSWQVFEPEIYIIYIYMRPFNSVLVKEHKTRTLHSVCFNSVEYFVEERVS